MKNLGPTLQPYNVTLDRSWGESAIVDNVDGGYIDDTGESGDEPIPAIIMTEAPDTESLFG